MKRFTLRITDMVDRKLQLLAKQEKRSKNQIIIMACENFIKNSDLVKTIYRNEER